MKLGEVRPSDIRMSNASQPPRDLVWAADLARTSPTHPTPPNELGTFPNDKTSYLCAHGNQISNSTNINFHDMYRLKTQRRFFPFTRHPPLWSVELSSDQQRATSRRLRETLTPREVSSPVSAAALSPSTSKACSKLSNLDDQTRR